MTAIQKAVVDDLGNINVHGRSGLEIVWKIKDADANLINISASDLFVEIAGKIRIALTAGEDNYSRKLTLTRAQVATLPLNQPLDYALHDETPSSPATIWSGKITAYGFRTAPSGADAVAPGTASWTGATVTVQQGESVPTVVVTYMGATGYGVPTGGTSGQYLRKNSATEFDWAFDTITSADVSGLDAQLAAKQPLDSDLTTIAANITAAGHALIDDDDAAAQRTTMGVAIGSDVQAYSAQLATLAAFDGVFYANPDTIDPTGATDVTALLASLLSTAGSGSVVHLHPNATYLISASLTTATNQRIIGNGATLKRRNQIVTTTTTAMTSGSTTSVTLTDASSFAVGMDVAFAQQGVARSALVYLTSLSDVRRITAKSGNQITLNTAVNCNVSIGGTCFLSFTSLILAAGASMDGVYFDGNRSNWSYARWEVTVEASALSVASNCDFLNCKFINAPGEGILPYADNISILNCRFSAIGGNGIHLSGVAGALIHGNKATNGNIDTDVGHADGFISFSNSNDRVVITGNHADTFISGVGALDDTDSNVTISNNDFKTMYCFGVQGGGSITNLVITDNRIDGVCSNTSKKTGNPYYAGINFVSLTGDNVLISGNLVRNVTSPYYALGVSMASGGNDIKITGNHLLAKTEIAALVDGDFSGNTVDGLLVVALATRVTIKNNTVRPPAGSIGVNFSGTGAYEDIQFDGNTVIGGTYGVNFSANGSSSYKGISVARNKFYDQASRGANIPTGAGSVDGFSVDGNHFRVGSGSATDYLGIVVTLDAVSITRNLFTNAIGASSRYGIYAPGASTPALIVANNIVRDAWSQTISLTASSGCWCIGNILKTKASQNPTGNNVSTEIVM